MSLLEHTPRFRKEEAIRFARELYGIRATASPLPSERDLNFLLDTETEERFVFKIANALQDRAFLEAQNQAMAHLTKHKVVCSRVVPTTVGDLITKIRSSAGVAHWVRLVSYVPGIPFAELRRHSAELLSSLGDYLGQLDRAFASFDHPATHRDFHWDLANALQVVRKYKSFIAEAELHVLIDKFVADFERNVVPLLPKLRKSVIHNDANDYNVIVGGDDDLYTRNQRVVGIIDLGDMVYSYTIGDLAIAIAYAILDKPDPLATAALVVKGYHAKNPLQDDEISALFGLACMRLCVSACIAAYQRQQRPDDAYLTISQGPIRHTLPKLAQVHPRFAEATFRHACGLPPVPHTEPICDWLQRNAHTMAPVLGVDLSIAPCIVFDLSVGSPLVGPNSEAADQRPSAEPTLTRRLFDERTTVRMKASGTQVGIGRHDEPRLLYADHCPTAPSFGPWSSATGDVPIDERPTIHIGMDLFAEAGTAVYAPLAGTVHAFSRNDAPQAGGPVIVLQHHLDRGPADHGPADDGEIFYTLYGHLSEASLAELHVGKSFARGQEIGTIGAPDVNGMWTPYLHFQIITDLLDLDCDFPGVCRASQRDVWTCFSPDPNLILCIPAHRFPPRASSKEETLAARRKYIGRNLSIGYKTPLKIERGWMQYLYDETGRTYLDAYNNVPHVGHCHPRVVQAGQQQMAVLNTNTRYLHDYLNDYAERLCATMPGPLRVCFFVNSGSEANELALRLARAHTRQCDMIVLEGAYHGHTTTLIDISPYKHNGPGGTGAPPWVHTVPVADVYRGPYKADDPQAAAKYAQHVLEIVETLRRNGTGLAGFIAETCPSVGGQILFPEGYLAHVYRYVREAGGVCIADEVQTGYGRMGTHFYAFEAQGVVPDIVVLGKPIGNGHPIGAVVTTAEIAASFDNGMEFFSTFGGNTVSCAIGLAVLDVVLEENLQAHALRVGDHLLSGLCGFKDRYPIVGDVRGSGLFLGVELVRDRETLEPAGEEASFIANRMREGGILLGTDGPYHNVVKIRPPMPFSESDVDLLVATMDRILTEDFAKNAPDRT
jgi:4-aminobutyrate aminotransferase-like enzyme/Ser/Thr protein kinase RdoA (MazF antagonist)